MTSIVVTVKHKEIQRDLALPLNISGQVLAQAIAKALEVPSQPSQFFSLAARSGKEISVVPSDRTLLSAGVMYGDILELISGELPGDPPTPKRTPVLVTKDGKTFSLKSPVTLVGRRTPNVHVDLDLTAVDQQRLMSRWHASIEQNKDTYYLVDEGSTNGTWLEGQRIPPHQAQKLQDGNTIQFGGPGGPTLTFISKP
jgi:hypothetical protein